MTSSVHLVIQGRVQGVGFRAYVWRRAVALGISGWVRNRPDGAVELEAEGERARLEILVDEVRQGPPYAQVAEAREAWSQGAARYQSFEIH